MRVYAPPQLAPKFSPDGPSATVPVLGCSFPEESYPSLANQPSTGAKQGDVRCASERGAVPLTGSFLSPWLLMPLWPPRPALALGTPRLLAGPRLWSHLREPRGLLQEGPSSQHWARETNSTVPASKRHQPQHGQEGPGHSFG